MDSKKVEIELQHALVSWSAFADSGYFKTLYLPMGVWIPKLLLEFVKVPKKLENIINPCLYALKLFKSK